MSDETNKPNGGLSALLEKIKTDKKVRNGVLGGALALVLLIIIIICVIVSNKKNGNTDAQVSGNELVSENVEQADVTATGELIPTTDETILQLINTYFNALASGDSATVSAIKTNVTEEDKIELEKKAEYEESIDNIQVYTRPGPSEGTYVAFVYYEIKFYDIETKAPGITTIYICSNEDGSLYINNGEWDEETTLYIQQLASEEAVKNYFEQVQVAFTEAKNKDVALALCLEQLPAILEQAVLERQQAAEQENAGEPQEQTATAVNETVTTITKVNVRASDSENADRIGQVEAGTTLTRYEVRENGWSKIDYNGQEGYIKSEFLQAEETADAGTTEEVAETGQTETQQAGAAQATGTVTVKEAVHVRASASTNGDDLGTVYEGETYDLIMEQADGWCKIQYNGKTAYIKSDFVEIH